MTNILLPIIAITAFVALYVWFIYNDLVSLRLKVKEAWSQIEVQLKRRADLIPNLVEAVKGYTKHEKSVLENVTKARAALLKATTPQDLASANNQLVDALKTLFAVAENYPQLKASENFLQLQRELGDTEDKVAFARQFYNTSVLEYNTKLQLFPNIYVARKFNFKEEEFFDAEEIIQKKPKVEFD